MKLLILQFSPTKDSHLSALEAEFEKRLRPFCDLQTKTLKASSSDRREQAQSEEAKILLEKWPKDHHVIALTEDAKQVTSPDFAQLIQTQRDQGPGKIAFLIGGSHGLHPEILEKANQKLSLSKMTFTHEMVRVFLKEQLYRAMMILAGKTYHK